MRSTLVSAALVLVVAATSSCRIFPGRSGPSRAGTTAAVGEAAPPSGLGTRVTYRLPNGLRVVLEENHAAPVVALQAWIAAGASNDPVGQEGLAHLFQHLLLQSAGAPAASATQATRDLAAVGARVGAWTTVDDTVVAGVLAAPFIDVGVRALAALLSQPSLAPPDIEAARRAARDDLRQASQVPGRVAAQAALTTAFPGHPYGRSLMGTDASLGSLGVTQIQAFWETFYAPDNITLVIVGDFDAATTRALVLAAFGGWQSRKGAWTSSGTASDPGNSTQTAPQVAVFTAQVPTPEVAVAFRIPGMKAAEIPALELLAALLGPRRGGRLDVEVVRNRQLVTNPRAFLFNAHQGGLLITTATLGPGRADEAAHAIRDEILRFTREQVSADELARARTLVEGDGAMDKATIGGYARKLGMSMAVAGDPTFEATYLDRLRKVDPGDLRKVAARTFVLTNLSVTVVLPTARDPQNDDRAASLLPRLRAVASAPTAPESGPMVSTTAVAASGRDVMEYLLPSGVRLLVLRDDTAPQLSVRAAWPGGARVQDARLAGASSLMARLFARATKTRPADVLANELAEVAGTIDGAAGIDSLTVRGDFLASRWERGLELMVDCLRNPRLSDEDIERERRVLLDAVRARNDDPTEIALRLFRGALFGRHPY
ncbi:MAG: insulinase family protein, partial [Polyangia bacterium]